MFVDNLFVLLSEEDKITQSAENLEQIFKENGMPLHEFALNSKYSNDKFKHRNVLTDKNKLKTLGLLWDFEEDQWYSNQKEFSYPFS